MARKWPGVGKRTPARARPAHNNLVRTLRELDHAVDRVHRACGYGLKPDERDFLRRDLAFLAKSIREDLDAMMTALAAAQPKESADERNTRRARERRAQAQAT